MSKSTALAEADAWLNRLGLEGFGSRYPHELSGGQRKRVAIAQILALKPKLLLMDEPFASLDAIVRTRITQELLNWVEREHLSVFLVTHDLEEAITVSDTVYLLSQGPRARVQTSYEVSIPRPRDIFACRRDPSFAPLLERLWKDMSDVMGVQQVEAAK
jgi:NitT/TauT family transport system ATP-binding protein